AGLSPEPRAIPIAVLTVPLALGNFYMIFRAIYDIGREDAKREVIEITPLDIPDFIQADTLTDSKIREMEEFFNQFNKEDNE
ncbi:TraL conjugative transposon family protein, partial [Phocaeicola plebeius]|uniref:TraL conjugative transposon family protein n=1 Tax=Phocaeicola plebeius TaxID=310297 RepID=UPI003FD86402